MVSTLLITFQGRPALALSKASDAVYQANSARMQGNGPTCTPHPNPTHLRACICICNVLQPSARRKPAQAQPKALLR